MSDDNSRPGPEVRANSFRAAFCDDPNCGLHLVGSDRNGNAMCEIVMSPSQTLTIIELCKDFLYDKAVKKS